MKKKNLEVIYFHKSIDNDNINIKDIGYGENHLCGRNILKPDPLYIDINGNNIIFLKNKQNIKIITLGFCRPSFRKSIFKSIDDYENIIFHFYIVKYIDGIRNNIYISSGKINKDLTGKNHNQVKKKLNIPLFYLDTICEYDDYKYKYLVDKEYDPLLVFDTIKNYKMKNFINIKELDNKYKFKNGNTFISFNQTQSSCPFIEI